jgi:PAS domain S-box-containing protein
VDGVFLADEGGAVIEWNTAMQTMTGLGRLDVLGRGLWEVQAQFIHGGESPPGTIERLREIISRCLRTGCFPQHLAGVNSATITRSGGEQVSVESAVFPIRTEAGYMIGAVVRDVTARKAAERERERLIRELQAVLGEVKQLSGLLPICSHCKKIRDDKGYWHRVEVYIKDHTGADFSHGLCPECLEKYYKDANLGP